LVDLRAGAQRLEDVFRRLTSASGDATGDATGDTTGDTTGGAR
jgi:hypothetical protein